MDTTTPGPTRPIILTVPTVSTAATTVNFASVDLQVTFLALTTPPDTSQFISLVTSFLKTTASVFDFTVVIHNVTFIQRRSGFSVQFSVRVSNAQADVTSSALSTTAFSSQVSISFGTPVTVSPPVVHYGTTSSSSNDSKGTSTGAIVGIVMGVAVFVGVVAALLWRRAANKEPSVAVSHEKLSVFNNQAFDEPFVIHNTSFSHYLDPALEHASTPEYNEPVYNVFEPSHHRSLSFSRGLTYYATEDTPMQYDAYDVLA